MGKEELCIPQASDKSADTWHESIGSGREAKEEAWKRPMRAQEEIPPWCISAVHPGASRECSLGAGGQRLQGRLCPVADAVGPGTEGLSEPGILSEGFTPADSAEASDDEEGALTPKPSPRIDGLPAWAPPPGGIAKGLNSSSYGTANFAICQAKGLAGVCCHRREGKGEGMSREGGGFSPQDGSEVVKADSLESKLLFLGVQRQLAFLKCGDFLQRLEESQAQAQETAGNVPSFLPQKHGGSSFSGAHGGRKSSAPLGKVGGEDLVFTSRGDGLGTMPFDNVALVGSHSMGTSARLGSHRPRAGRIGELTRHGGSDRLEGRQLVVVSGLRSVLTSPGDSLRHDSSLVPQVHETTRPTISGLRQQHEEHDPLWLLDGGSSSDRRGMLQTDGSSMALLGTSQLSSGSMLNVSNEPGNIPRRFDPQRFCAPGTLGTPPSHLVGSPNRNLSWLPSSSPRALLRLETDQTRVHLGQVSSGRSPGWWPGHDVDSPYREASPLAEQHTFTGKSMLHKMASSGTVATVVPHGAESHVRALFPEESSARPLGSGRSTIPNPQLTTSGKMVIPNSSSGKNKTQANCTGRSSPEVLSQSVPSRLLHSELFQEQGNGGFYDEVERLPLRRPRRARSRRRVSGEIPRESPEVESRLRHSHSLTSFQTASGRNSVSPVVV